jgi:hypothetical protein
VVGSIRDHTSVEEDSSLVKSGMHKCRRQRLIRDRTIEGDLVHKARAQHATVEEEEL